MTESQTNRKLIWVSMTMSYFKTRFNMDKIYVQTGIKKSNLKLIKKYVIINKREAIFRKKKTLHSMKTGEQTHLSTFICTDIAK